MTPLLILNNNLFGLQKADMGLIVAALQKESAVEEAVIFGSRAKGSYTNGSDVDIALKGSAVIHATICSISFHLNEETIMPYRFDILNYHTISNNNLIVHIDHVGVTIYKK